MKALWFLVQKLTDVRDEDIPDINNPKTMEAVLEGDKLMKEVLNGGYNVHPVPPPNSEIKVVPHNQATLNQNLWNLEHAFTTQQITSKRHVG